MSGAALLGDLTVILLAASAALLLVRRLKQPPVLGYIAAGVLAGPLVSDHAMVEALSEVGVVFLLFALGVEFNLKRLAAVGGRALAAAGLEAALMLAGAWAVGVAVGWPRLGALMLGAGAAVASTAIVARGLMSRAGAGGWMELAAGVLVAEDILAVAFLAFFSSAAALEGDALASAARELSRLGMLATLVLVSGLLILPRVLRMVERSGIKEVRTLVIVGTCFAVALLTRELGYSSALGAFLAGAMMSETAHSTRLRETAEPFKDVFGSVFFVSVGMLLDAAWMKAHWTTAASFVGLLLAGRLAANCLAFALAGEDGPSSLKAAAARLPIGEFSFILARLADQQNAAPWPLFPLTVAGCVASTFAAGAFHEAFAADPGLPERWTPRWVARFLDEYRAALRRLSVPRQARVVWDLTRPSVVQIFLNLLGLSGLFLAAGRLKARAAFEADLPGAVWMLTALLTLPFLMALWRKTQAVALIVLEAVTTRPDDDRPPAEARPGLTRATLALATVLVAWWYLSLSVPLLPPGRAALVPLAVIAGAGALLWRAANKLYARIQANLREALSKADAEPGAGAAVVSHLVEEGDAVRVVALRLGAGAKGLGKSLKELDLRAATGASIVQVNRGGAAFVAPSPLMRFHAGDEVLVVGAPEQVAAAREFLI